ncbi:quinoprotein dehydrogenase-associated SoxYZ-like carrier [Xanthobacter autotrophicus]|uniref:quinoprotein dehydrogenase-associated SoxYZ-like carrier n=1 Tax=Xanthobacter autotrophicus TaxID=280 RepID=UPI0024A6F2C5|nr:quinoprotein dehydrogenase-associated SoxYZ-like carrier [Xanthobacter autotrophicus]MDI4656877.1 quinoprotein dehydrogenase-associated SoxYZ-like carrier [Xanthobacter autotrophicus]
MMRRSSSRTAGRVGLLALALCASLPLTGPALAQEPAAQGAGTEPNREANREATWAAIRPDLFPGKAIAEAGAIVRLDAPGRAEDAALVPLTIELALPAGDPRTLKAVTLVVDENPAPMAGRFTLGAGTRAFSLSLRVRVNSYSFVRAVAETSDGGLLMTKAYVKAAGGCSAPATKDTADSIAHVGEMRFRSFAATGRPEAQVQIRHPNFSGLQIDQETRGYTPAWFVREVEVTQGEKLIFAMEGGISISEDPTFRFSYTPSSDQVSVRAEDTEGKVFTRSFPGGGS